MGFLDPWGMQDLLQSIQHLHFGLDIILVTPLSQNKNRQTTEVKPPPLSFSEPI